jgi:alpha-maltose-1-phosphate synthase
MSGFDAGCSAWLLGNFITGKEQAEMSQGNLEHRSILLLHPTGNANVRQAALALYDARMLAAFHTTIAWRTGSTLDRFVPGGMRTELARRSYTDIPAELVHTHPWHEMVRLIAQREGWHTLIHHEAGRFSIDAICAALDRDVAHTLTRGSAPDAVYAYDDCAEQTFTAAKRCGIRCIYELPIGHYRAYQRIVEEERELRPEWAPTLTGIRDSPEKLARKDREIAQAESILVASSFTAKTLNTYSGPLTSQISLVPYGAPPAGPARQHRHREDALRLLFVGSIGQRKGISYLFEAVDRLQVPYELTLLGRPVAKPVVMGKALGRHRWIESASHAEVLKLMREHDVLVFPSLFEGFGLVILEAMAQGTVVIATPHTAAPDLFDDGRDGFIVPIRSAEAIAQRLTQLAEDRDLLYSMSEAARQKAAEFSWERYRTLWVSAIRTSLDGRNESVCSAGSPA